MTASASACDSPGGILSGGAPATLETDAHSEPIASMPAAIRSSWPRSFCLAMSMILQAEHGRRQARIAQMLRLLFDLFQAGQFEPIAGRNQFDEELFEGFEPFPLGCESFVRGHFADFAGAASFRISFSRRRRFFSRAYQQIFGRFAIGERTRVLQICEQQTQAELIRCFPARRRTAQSRVVRIVKIGGELVRLGRAPLAFGEKPAAIRGNSQVLEFPGGGNVLRLFEGRLVGSDAAHSSSVYVAVRGIETFSLPVKLDNLTRVKLTAKGDYASSSRVSSSDAPSFEVNTSEMGSSIQPHFRKRQSAGTSELFREAPCDQPSAFPNSFGKAPSADLNETVVRTPLTSDVSQFRPIRVVYPKWTIIQRFDCVRFAVKPAIWA